MAADAAPLAELGAVSCVINTHLHFDHCGGNRRYAGLPTYVQRAELAASEGPDYVTEWARFAGGELRRARRRRRPLPGSLRARDAGAHRRPPGGRRRDGRRARRARRGVTYSMRQLIDGATESIRRIHDLRPRLVYLAHHERPWAPEYA